MGASIRASYTKLALKHFKKGFPSEWDRLRGAIGEGALARIRDASPLALLPVETHAAVAGAVVTCFGARDARAAWRDVMLDSFERSLLRPLVSGALRLYGRKPSSIMRMTPQGWALVFHECGRAWMEDAGDRRAWMRFESLPRGIAGSTGIVDSFAANCDAAIAHVKLRGNVAVHRDELEAGKLSIEVTWTA